MADGAADRFGWSAVLAALVEGGRLSRSAADRAERASRESGEPLDRVLSQLGLAAERDLLAAASEVFDLPVATPDDYAGTAALSASLSLAFLRRRRLAPLHLEDGVLDVAAADPTDAAALEDLARALDATVRVRMGAPSDIAAALERGESPAAAAGSGRDAAASDVERLRDLASEAPIVQLAARIIGRAIDDRASDVHLEPVEGGMRLRYRIDGALRDGPTPPPGAEAPLVSRIKIMAGLDIAERRLPQDGRMSFAHRGRQVDLRISTVPALLGEGVALRVLDRSAVSLELDALIPAGPTLQRWRDLLDRPNGILLMTGPTGSGKTTTLYASLRRLARPELKMLTVEDPVEFALEGALQVQVRNDIGLTFASALRAFLRHDPDIVMVGEIRDRETAEIAVQAALTGHLVLSTLHTNSAAGAIPRLLDMGVEPFLVASALLGVGAQRLVRRLCPDCRAPHAPDPGLAERFDLARLGDGAPPRLWRPVGCARCDGAGFSGRIGVVEVMAMDDRLRALALSAADAGGVGRAAVAGGMEPLLTSGLRLALAGQTTLDEVLRAAGTD
jgi:general secretion pathway protein E